MKTRQEKIDFLKRLSIGRTTIEEVLPANLSIDITDDGTKFSINNRTVNPEEFFDKVNSSGDEKTKFNLKII
jgi:hypothetical protein